MRTGKWEKQSFARRKDGWAGWRNIWTAPDNVDIPYPGDAFVFDWVIDGTVKYFIAIGYGRKKPMGPFDTLRQAKGVLVTMAALKAFDLMPDGARESDYPPQRGA